MSLAFEADTARGTLRLQLPGAAGDAVAAALALAEYEALVAALEATVGQALDPRPTTDVDDGGLIWADAGRGARIGWPWPLLASLAAPPAWPMQWPTLAFEVDVAGFDEAPLPTRAPAGVLLLPGAFEPAWRVALHTAEPALAAEAQWRGPGQALAICMPPEPAAAPRPPWRVQLAEPWHGSLPELLGWARPAPVRAAADAWLVGPEGPLRRGRIAPALGGAGLWLAD